MCLCLFSPAARSPASCPDGATGGGLLLAFQPQNVQLFSSVEAHCCNAIRENNTFNNSGPETVRGVRRRVVAGGWVEERRLKVPQNGSFSSCYALLKLYRTPSWVFPKVFLFSFSFPLSPKACEVTNNSSQHL